MLDKKIYIAGLNNLDYINTHYIENIIKRKGFETVSAIEECSNVLIPHDLRYHSSTLPDEEKARILKKNIIHERDL